MAFNLRDVYQETLSGNWPVQSKLQIKHDFVEPYSYCGKAAKGEAETASSWTIIRLNINAQGEIVATQTAQNAAWSSRLTLEYF